MSTLASSSHRKVARRAHSTSRALRFLQAALLVGCVVQAAACADADTDAATPTLALQASDAGTPPVAEDAPLVAVDVDGPFKTTEDFSSGPRGRSGVVRPASLGDGATKFPVFVWGCGGGSNPRSYQMHLRRIASHGIVVIAEVSEIGDNGAPLLAAHDWLKAENDRAQSPFYQKLDLARSALGGHSIGSVNAFVVAPDPRWVTSIHVAGGSLDNPRNVRAPTTGKGGKGLVHPAAFICSESDSFGNVEKTQKDYDQATAPVFFTIMKGTDHVAAAREGLPAMVAWLRWHLVGETARRAQFLEPTGVFRSGKWSSRVKNW